MLLTPSLSGKTTAMETLGSILETGNIILFLIVFIALAMIPMIRTRREARRLRDKVKELERAMERLELEKDVYNPANHDARSDKAGLAGVNQKYVQ